MTETTIIDCCECNAEFVIDAGVDRSLRLTRHTFHCPYCGVAQSYKSKKTANEKRIDFLERQLDDAQKSVRHWAEQSHRYKCPIPYCRQDFSTKREAWNHIKEAHADKLETP